MSTMHNLEDLVWSCLSNDDDLETVFGGVDLETRIEVRNVVHQLWMKFNDNKLHLQDTYNRLVSAAKDEEDFERLAKSHPDRDILMAMWLDEDINGVVWKRVKP